LSRALVRIAFVLFGLFGVGEFVYIVLWILIPRAHR
jgi:phage shock protein C